MLYTTKAWLKTFAVSARYAAIGLIFIAGMSAGVRAQESQYQDPRPYAPIAIQLPDTLDQMLRDSATIKIGRVRVNQAGYRPNDEKAFYYVGRGGFSGGAFSVIDANTGREVSTGTLLSRNTTVSGQLRMRGAHNALSNPPAGAQRYAMESEVVAGPLYEGIISLSSPGQYRVRVGSDTSAPFWIHESVYSWVRDAAIKFPGVNRCGNTDSWFHGACHIKDATPGGWHDCGDHLKEAATISWLHSMLGLGAAALRDHDVDNYGRNHNNTVHTDGIPDVLYEAKHGSDYIIAAYNNAGGNVANMVTAIAQWGPGPRGDHRWWGRPENHERISTDNGGPPRIERVEVGANIVGAFAAGLALTAVPYAAFDKRFADTSIAIAKKLYEYGRANQVISKSDAYYGQTTYNGQMAFAAVALAWVTGERKYLVDLAYDPTLGPLSQSSSPQHGHALFDGGWFTNYDPVFSKQIANTDWASPQMAVKWAFFRLILKDEAMCTQLGITPEERLKLIGKTIYQMAFSLGSISGQGTATQELPHSGLWVESTFRYDPVWYGMHIQQSWMWNRYQFGNIFDLFAYSDMAKWVQDTLVSNGIFLAGPPDWGSGGEPEKVSDWKADEVRRLMLRQLNYMLGVNPWDVSMIYGVGAKNHNHPHHRAANPEGKNTPGGFYPYRPPVGALHAGVNPYSNAHYEGMRESWNEHTITETGIDASATIIIPLMALSKEEPITDPPTATVRIVYVGVDQAIIEVRQSRFGMTAIRYAEDGVGATTSLSADSNGVFHRITLTGLKAGTRYNFDALVSDMFGNSDVINDRGEPFTFVTLASPPGTAEIVNVKVCKVTSDSAEVFWYTPNGNYDSKVVYGTSKPVTAANGMVQDQNIYGRPTQFHYVKIGGLKEQTTYYFYVENNGAIDDNNGQFYEFTTPVEHVKFDVRAVLYEEGGAPTVGMNIVNQDSKDYDSLEMRIYVRGPDSVRNERGIMVSFEDYVGFRIDIGIKYREDAYQGRHFKSDIDQRIQAARVIRMGDTYDPADGTWAYYVPIFTDTVRMESGSRFRLDFSFRERSPWEPHNDLILNSIVPDVWNTMLNGWSFAEHRKTNGAPADYPGIPTSTKEDVDNDYWNVPINPYITIYRKGEFVWGYSPSTLEQQEKKTYYQLMSQIVRPIHNPSEEYLFLEQVMPSITVNGYAKLTDEAGNTNGEITEIWVNGVRVRDVGSVAQYSSASDLWNLSIPVPVRSGGNNVDITIFGGPDPNCASCHGCAFTNHSFYIEFRGADPYPSSIKLLTARDINSAEVKDTAVIGSTRFYIYVDDENGNLNKDARDTVWVTVVNPVLGDSIRVALIETGNETGQFLSDAMISVVDHTVTARGPNDIPMDGGQVIWVTYVDITDPNDVSRAILSSRAEFAVPSAAWFKDENGIGSVDQVFIRYDKIPNPIPDSLHLTVPTAIAGETTHRAVRAPDIAAVASDRSVVLFSLDPPIEGTTGFRANERMDARSFLMYNNVVRVAVIPVADSAGPALLDRALLFEKAGTSALDTLQVTMSEPVPSSNVIGSTLVLRKAHGADAALPVIGVVDSSSLTNSLTLIVNPQENRIVEGDSVFINPIGTTTDRFGNNAHMSNRPVPVALRSAAPRFTSAIYKDEDGDGMIDIVEMNLSRSLDLTGFRLWLAWENGQFVPVEWSDLSINAAETVIRAQIEGLLTGDSIVTSGRMRAMATHTRFPGDTLRADVSDRAAPVILRAQFAPGHEKDKDTLHVAFSEPVSANSASIARPFKFLYGDDGTVYEMILQNPNARASASQTFIVNGIENPSGYPTQNDSVWISTDVIFADTNVNFQSVENNRRVKLGIKPAPITITVIPAPNPFVPESKADGRPARIIVRPASKVLVDLDLKGTIRIYDRLGNVVIADALKPADDGSPDLIYEWTGRNSKGRKVGSGTYLVTATVEHVQESWEEKIAPVTGRTLIYLKR